MQGAIASFSRNEVQLIPPVVQRGAASDHKSCTWWHVPRTWCWGGGWGGCMSVMRFLFPHPLTNDANLGVNIRHVLQLRDVKPPIIHSWGEKWWILIEKGFARLRVVYNSHDADCHTFSIMFVCKTVELDINF
ncbi:hypothetical protein CEXT_399391 [Caerostris extrusa]|uniref:Uncharacterized protein n=1 Tax=Caerostris extrusa TaxID=172846 RepID=A0AAV4QSY3_CAEEX|nr:hypothetical protein CEXT_399391 [Caerostris extrusa]